MKRLFILVVITFFPSCYYSDGCFYSPQSVSCVDKGSIYPAFSRYQKYNSIGRTNSQQRWNDIIECGGKYNDQDLRYINDNGLYNIFEKCMFDKGYKYFHPAECGFQDPKWDKGVCNL